MTARRPTLLPAALLSAALLGVACSDHGPLVPEGDAPTGAVSGGTGRPDSTGTATPLPTSVRAYGRVLAVSFVTPQPGSADSLRFAPVPNARIQLVRNVLENGAAVQKLARELTADASGAWSASGLEGGYYIVKAAAPAGSGLKDGWEYLPATQAEVKRDVYLWADR
jgi:hypothetical protein